MKTVRVRLEWGAYVTYLKHPTQMPRIDWSGCLRVYAGKVIHRERYELGRMGWAPAAERRWEMNGSSWQSSPGNRIEGVLIEVQPTGRTAFSVRFEWGSVSFTLAELNEKLVLEWPVGPKYRFLTLRASLADVDPLEVGFHDDPLPEACPPPPEVVVHARQFTNARCFFSYFRREPAWIEQMKEASAGFHVQRAGRCHLVLYLMLGPPYATEGGERGKSNRTMRFEVLLNGRSLGVRERAFTYFRHGQKVEEINLRVPEGMLRRGRNAITIRNHDHCCHLLVVKAELRDKPLQDRFPKAKLPRGYYCGLDTNTIAPENKKEFREILRNVRRSGVGNYVLLRPEGSLIHAEDIDGWIEILKREGITFSYLWDETSYTRQIQKKAGRFFLGQMFHEISSDGNSYSSPLVRRHRRPTMRTAYVEYLAYVRRIVQALKQASPKTRAIVGEAGQFAALDYLAGVDIVLAEVNTGHVGLLLAEARGAHRTLEKDLFGAHVAGGAIRFPVLPDMERQNETTLHACYLHGVRLLYDEESALTMIHGKPYSLQSRFCRGRRALLARYNRFVAGHGSPGEPIVHLALMNGRFECPFPPGEKVWNKFGGQDETWAPAEPEFGWELIDNFLPGFWTPALPQNWKKIRFWHAGTPYGQFDIVSSEAPARAMRRYRSIIFPGWNSMDRRLYRKLISYVRGGGRLLMALPQLSTKVDREFLKDMKDLDLINGGDLSALFGVRIETGTHTTGDVHFERSADPFRWGKVFRMRPALRNSRAAAGTAEVLARDQSGRPVLVQNRVGKGVARLLTLREYPGARGAKRLMSALWKSLAVEARGEVWVDDPSAEVAWYLFSKAGKRFLWLHNTDWVTQGNLKSVRVHIGNRVLEVAVRQGEPVCLPLESRALQDHVKSSR